ncbi:MAG: CDP-alcohol phosphatidyltransferase family protein [Hyphomonadaceae bacterium]
MLKLIPNALTLLRLVLAPVIAWLWWVSTQPMYEPDFYENWLRDAAGWRTAAAALFVVAALTDLFDGMAARAFDAHSKFGRLIDPIADKALVGLPLIVIALGMWSSSHPAWPIVAAAATIIVIRDIGMTILRLVSPDGEGARVSPLAKIKTALELIVIGSLFVITAILSQLRANDPTSSSVIPGAQVIEVAWLALLVVAAALSAYTAFQYLTAKRRAS